MYLVNAPPKYYTATFTNGHPSYAYYFEAKSL